MKRWPLWMFSLYQLAELWPSLGGGWYEEGLSRGRGTGAPGKGSRGEISIQSLRKDIVGEFSIFPETQQ